MTDNNVTRRDFVGGRPLITELTITERVVVARSGEKKRELVA